MAISIRLVHTRANLVSRNFIEEHNHFFKTGRRNLYFRVEFGKRHLNKRSEIMSNHKGHDFVHREIRRNYKVNIQRDN